MLPGPVVTPQASYAHPSSYHHPVSALGSRSPFLASPTSPTARTVRRQLCRVHRRPAPHHPASSPRVAARARWTRRRISARIQPVPLGAGWGSAISAPMDFLPFVNPHGSVFLPHLHGRLTTNSAGIIAGTIPQHG